MADFNTCARRVLPPLVALALLLAPATAGATIRLAEPDSLNTSGDCILTACTIERAVAAAVDGDTVELAAGEYTVTSPVAPAAAINIRGTGQQASHIIGSGGTLVALDMANGGTVTNLKVSNGTNMGFALGVEGATIDRVVAEATGTASGAVELRPHPDNVVLRNSVVNVPSGTADAIQVKDNGVGGSVSILGVTAVSAAGSGVEVKSSSAATRIKNTVITAAKDIEVKNTAMPPVVSFSNYRTTTGIVSAGTGNDTAAPIFLAGGEFKQDPLSPTVNAGDPDAEAGGKDLFDGLRTSDGRIDIGAHEIQVAEEPPATEPPATEPPAEEPPATKTDPATSTTGNPPAPGTGDGAAPALPPAVPPVLAATVTVGGVKGRPLVQLPGTTRFVPLTSATTVPVGAVVDATRGHVKLTSVRDRSGKLQSGTFWGGVFRVRQSRRDAYTELVLAGTLADCASGRRGKGVQASRARRRWSRRLWGRDRGGRFRTRGRHGTATVRGTRWLTEDRCDGTLFKVTEGKIDVRDHKKRKTVRLKRGGSYLAAAPGTAKRRRK